MPPFSTGQPLSVPTDGELDPPPVIDAHGVALRHTSAGVLVTLHGEVDCADGPGLSAVRALLTAWQEHPVVDASGVTFIDAAGLRAVLSLTVDGSALLVLAPSPVFCHLLHLLHLVGSSIQAVPAETSSSLLQPGSSRVLPPGSVLVQDRRTSARVPLPCPTPTPAPAS